MDDLYSDLPATRVTPADMPGAACAVLLTKGISPAVAQARPAQGASFVPPALQQKRKAAVAMPFVPAKVARTSECGPSPPSGPPTGVLSSFHVPPAGSNTASSTAAREEPQPPARTRFSSAPASSASAGAASAPLLSPAVAMAASATPAAEDPDLIAADTFPAPGDCPDEYDPARPNEYGAVLRARADAAAAQARAAELAAQAAAMMRERQAALTSLGFAAPPPPPLGAAVGGAGAGGVGSSHAAGASSSGADEAAVAAAPLSALSLGVGRGRGGVDMRPAWMTAAAAAAANSNAAANSSAGGAVPAVAAVAPSPGLSAAPAPASSAGDAPAFALPAASSSPAAQAVLPSSPAAQAVLPSLLSTLAAGSRFSPPVAAPAPPAGLAASAIAAAAPGFAWSQGGHLPASSTAAAAPSAVGAAFGASSISKGPTGPGTSSSGFSGVASGSGTGAGGGAGGSGSNISDKARRMMERWGYTEGRGLGKHETGITAPLVHVKTGRITGVIRGGGRKGPVAHTSGVDAMPDGFGLALAGSSAGSAGGMGNTFVPGALLQSSSATSSSTSAGPSSSASASAGAAAAPAPSPSASRVLLLRNMVGPGEVDDELEGEVRDECAAKYGPVAQVLIFECTGISSGSNGSSTGGSAASLPPEEAVRIFVEFVDLHSAARALAGLDGRYFGERRLAAGYYDESKFARLDLV